MGELVLLLDGYKFEIACDEGEWHIRRLVGGVDVAGSRLEFGLPELCRPLFRGKV